METEGQNPKDDDIDEQGEGNDSDSSGDFEATKKKLKQTTDLELLISIRMQGLV